MSLIQAYNEIQQAAREGRISKVDLIGIGEELISYAIGREVCVKDLLFGISIDNTGLTTAQGEKA